MSNLARSWAALRLLIGPLAFLLSPTTVVAAPIELTAAQWTALTAALPRSVEDFDSLALGAHASPMTIANGTYTALTPTVTAAPAFCGAGDQCLIESTSSFHTPRVFSAFPAGTTFWAATDFVSLNPVDGDVFRVTVVGVSGISVFTHPLADGLVGYTDPTGLLSVTFEILGEGVPGAGIFNYSLDDVTTAPAVISEPLSLVLVGPGLIAWRHRRSAAVQVP
jgi:hypothetical protein